MTGCFSVIASGAPARLGKTYSISDGKLTKTSVASITKGVALTFPATAENFVAALRRTTESNNLALVLDSFIGAAPDSPEIQVVTEDRLQSLTGGKIGDTNGQGFFSIGGAIVSARLKRLMQGSGWILLDADSPEGMPEAWARLTLTERLTRLEPILPGISTCRRIEYLGSSARVVNGSGAAKPEATHALIEISDPARLTLLRDHVRVESVRQGLSFPSPRRSRTSEGEIIGQSHLTLVDWSVWTTGRLIFNAKPNVDRAPGYRVLDAGVKIVNPDGGVLDIDWVKPPDAAALKHIRAKTGLDLRFYNDHGGGLAVHENGTLKLSTEIESRGTAKPLADWLVQMLDGDINHLRCETPFRSSTSEAAFIRITESGEIFVHDAGTSTSFYLDRLDEETTDPSALAVIAAKTRQIERRKPKNLVEEPRPLMRELPPADPFPIGALGGVLAPAARGIHDRVQAPLAICGQSVLAAATLAVQGHADIELPTGQKRPLSENYLTVAQTGERKTSADAEALGPVRKRETALYEEYGATRYDYENSQLAWEKARDAAIKAVRPKDDREAIKFVLNQLGPAPPAPLVAMLTCPEPTYEDGEAGRGSRGSRLSRPGQRRRPDRWQVEPGCLARDRGVTDERLRKTRT